MFTLSKYGFFQLPSLYDEFMIFSQPAWRYVNSSVNGSVIVYKTSDIAKNMPLK